MKDTWGNLNEEAKKVIGKGARKFTEDEVNERFIMRDKEVLFRILCKTDRALAGGLDIELSEEELETAGPEAGADIAEEEFISPEAAAAESMEEQEFVEMPLISPEDFDYEPDISDEDKKAAIPIEKELSGLEGYFKKESVFDGEMAEDTYDADEAGLPEMVDHRSEQSPVKNQGGRGTCVAHASMAVIEAFGHIPDDLSEQYTHYKFNEIEGRPHNINSGLRTTNAAPYLARSDGRVCLESEWPYITQQGTINSMVADGVYGPPQAAVANQTYGYGQYKIITDQGLTGESIKNTRYLEALLYKGYNIVIGTWVSWDDKDNNGILDPVLDPNGDPIGRGGHAMLVVGYNRTSQYFILKNSWGRGWGHDGYAYLHYNLVRSCFKYGFVLDGVVPAAPSRIPGKLGNAPYSTTSLSRSKLRAAVLFVKTSQGRYAVCEAYAGYNLLLRNIKVYNADGSTHLEKDSLLVRGTYLFDLDNARETSTDADFWWEAVRPGVNNLVPRNGAEVCIAYDFAGLTANRISGIPLSSSPVPYEKINYAVVVGRTTANRRFKMLVHAKPGNKLQISCLELYDCRGRRFRFRTNLSVPSSWTYNLDTMRIGGGRYADIWWNMVSPGVGFLKRYSYAKTQLVWNL